MTPSSPVATLLRKVSTKAFAGRIVLIFVVSVAFGGLDTLLVSAGASALQPLVTGVANTPRDDKGNFGPNVPTKANVSKAKDVASKAMSANFIGPLVTAVSFVSSVPEERA